MELQEAQALVSHMQGHRALRLPRWRELKKWICPTRGIFDWQNDDYEDRHKLIRFTHAASSAVLRGASGMTSGMTPRNVAWFKPDFPDPNLLEASGARQWLDEVAKRMRDCLANGGFYQAIQTFNIDLLWSGCALLYSQESDNSPLFFQACQIGSFCVETGSEGQLLSVARRLKFTCQELIREFGESHVSNPVREKVKTSPWEPVYIWHLCRDTNKGISSLYWEEGGSDKFLRESSFHEMPFFFTCWHESTTPYGTGPGDEALPDSMQMDELERRKLEGLAKVTDPPVQINTQNKDTIDLSPGAVNYLPTADLVRSILDLSPYAHTFAQLREEIATVTQRLEQTLYASIFTSMPLDQRPRDMSATEFLERKREALQQLGPVISAYEPNVLTPPALQDAADP